MERVLVTGGAGFIGSNFVRHSWSTPRRGITVLDKLTYAASPESLAELPSDRVELVEADIAVAATVEPLVAAHDTVVHLAAESHNDNSLDDPALVRPDQPRRHVRPPRGGPEGATRASTTSPPTRCTATSRSTTRRASPRTRRTAPAAPTPPPRPAPTTSSAPGSAASGCAPRCPTAPTTTGPGSTSRSSSPGRSPRSSQGRRPRLYGSGQQVRDWIHVDDHSSALLTILERGRIGETYLVGADGERTNLEVVRLLLRLTGRARGRLRARHRPRWPRRPLRHRVRQTAPGTRLASTLRGLRAGTRRHRRLVHPSPGLVGTAQARHRGGVRRKRSVMGDLSIEQTPIRGLLVLRLDVRSDDRGWFAGDLAARQDDDARAARLRSGPGQHRPQRRPGRHPRAPRGAVGQAGHGRFRPRVRSMGGPQGG